MEGSFGTQKEHYGLKRIKARTKLTEILYIFFGIHTANAVQLVRREVNENCSGCLMFEVSEKRPFHWSIGSSWVQK